MFVLTYICHFTSHKGSTANSTNGNIEIHFYMQSLVEAHFLILTCKSRTLYTNCKQLDKQRIKK